MGRRFGQHFLVDPIVISSIISHLPVGQFDATVEIGPGKGALTSYLKDLYSNLHLIELDNRLLPRLQKHYSQATLHHHDAVTFDYSLIDVQRLLVVGNLPYEISSPLLFALANYEHVVDGYFMVQKEFAQRAVSACGCKSFGRLTVMLQNTFEVKWDFDVPPKAFSPPPGVDSAMIHLRRRDVPLTANTAALDNIVRKAFSQKRKMLRAIFKGDSVPWAEIGLSETARAEDISVEMYAKWASLMSAENQS